MEFEVKSLRSLTNLITKGTTPSNIGESFTDEGVMYFRSELVGRGKYIDKSSGLLFISEETHKKLKRSHIKTGDLLFSMAGAYLGKISLVSDEDVPSNTNQAVAIIRFKPDSCNVEYAYYFMTQKWFTEYVYSFNAQAAQPNINLEQIGKLKIALPSLHLQNHVVSILSAYDRLIELNNKRIKVLEQMAENLYKEWFVRFRFPGHETAEFENGIPKGWGKTKLKMLAKEVGNSEKAERRGKYSHYLPIDSLPSRSMALNTEDDIDHAESSLVSFKKGDILFGAMRPYFHKVLIAPFDGLTRTTCFVVNAIESEYRLFLYFLMFDDSTIDFATTISVGSTMPYVRWKDLRRMNCLKPGLGVIKAFNKAIDPIIEKLMGFYRINKNLIMQRDLLLPRLMSGKLEA